MDGYGAFHHLCQWPLAGQTGLTKGNYSGGRWIER